MGITPGGIIAVATVLGVYDVKEVLYKVADIVRTMRTISDELKDQDKGQKPFNVPNR